MSVLVKRGSERGFLCDGRAVRCPTCGGERFWSRRTQLNTAGMTFLGLDEFNRSAYNLVCGHCTHILWFIEPGRLKPSG